LFNKFGNDCRIDPSLHTARKGDGAKLQDLGVLESDLSLFFELSELVKVLEDQVLHSLFVYLYFDFMLLRQILQLSLLVSQLCLLVLQLLLANDPEVVDSLSLVLVKAGKILLLPDFVFESSALDTE
jgi:hypothetical protein